MTKTCTVGHYVITKLGPSPNERLSLRPPNGTGILEDEKTLLLLEVFYLFSSYCATVQARLVGPLMFLFVLK